jgi:hypothetical protein
MGLLWAGQTFDQMAYGIIALFEEIEVEARQILDDISRECVDDMYRILLAARTKTGNDREAAGQGIAGRVDTGQMSRDIKAALDAGLDGGVVLTWGWIANVEDYYLYQEYGTAPRAPKVSEATGQEVDNGHPGIKAMSALQQSYTKAREKFRQRLQDLGLEVT